MEVELLTDYMRRTKPKELYIPVKFPLWFCPCSVYVSVIFFWLHSCYALLRSVYCSASWDGTVDRIQQKHDPQPPPSPLPHSEHQLGVNVNWILNTWQTISRKLMIISYLGMRWLQIILRTSANLSRVSFTQMLKSNKFLWTFNQENMSVYQLFISHP